MEPTPAGCLAAAALVAAGAPVFASGLRALRLRRGLAALPERPLEERPEGFVLVRGRVALESPLVGPLSGKPCAGYRLEVTGPGRRRVAAIEERRPFRRVAGGTQAYVTGDSPRAGWHLEPGERRELAPGDRPSANVEALLARSAEVSWLRRTGARLELSERALRMGQEAFVIGSARPARPFEAEEAVEWSRTGTDDRSVARGRRAVASEPALWIEADPRLDCLRVFDRLPDPAAQRPAAWRALGAVAGPVLGLLGMLYLASAAERLTSRTYW